MTSPNAITDALSQLQVRERELMIEIAEHETELKRVRSAMAGLLNYVGGTRRGTYELIYEYVAFLGPDQPIEIAKLLAYAESRDWSTKAVHRRQTMSGALAQVASKGEVIRLGHGTYRTLPKGNDGSGPGTRDNQARNHN